LLSEALEATPGARGFLLRRIPDEGGTPARLESLGQGWWVTRLDSIEAPTMDMWAAQEALKKKSLKRHESVLSRAGDLETVRLNRAEEVLERLPLFFDQHIRRWQNTPSPSLFLVPRRQEFYRLLVRNLAESGSLRYTELRLDGRMVAAHLGAYYEGQFSWYKPTFEPTLAKLSPGEVLLKRLIEQAAEEGAREFDFTIGDEAFKKRFATRVRVVTDVHVTRSPFSAIKLRSSRACRCLARRVLRRVGLWEPIKRAFRAHSRPV
jgi:CelD/BcsL family acetyltransferase involved in cellulose biosynthesis